MIKNYSAYVLRSLLSNILFIFVSITLLIWITQILKFTSFAEQYSINMFKVLKLSGLITPYLMVTIIPFAVFLGVLTAILKLSNQNELVALYSLGIHRNKITRLIIVVVSSFAIITFLFFSFVVPKSYYLLKKSQIKMIAENSIAILKKDSFLYNNSQNIFMYARNIVSENEARGFMVNNISQINNKDTIIISYQASILASPSQLIANLTGGNEFAISKEEKSSNKVIDVVSFDDSLIDMRFSVLDKNNEKTWKFRPSQMYMDQLLARWEKIHRIEFHYRIIWSLQIISFGIAAAYFCLQITNNRSSVIKQTLKSFLLFIYFVVSSMILNNGLAATNYWWISYLNLIIPFGVLWLGAKVIMIRKNRKVRFS